MRHHNSVYTTILKIEVNYLVKVDGNRQLLALLFYFLSCFFLLSFLLLLFFVHRLPALIFKDNVWMRNKNFISCGLMLCYLLCYDAGRGS